VITHLSNVSVFGKCLKIGISKQEFVGFATPFQLPDGSPSFVDFQGSTNFRFSKNPDLDESSRMSPPSKRVYFFDPRNDLTEEDVELFLTENGAPKPVRIFFELETETRVNIEFGTIAMALQTIALCNNFPFSMPEIQGQFFVKFWFAE
jgi:hypothetical protein